MKPLLLIFLLVLFGIQLSNAFFSTYNFHQPINPLRRLRPMSREQRAQYIEDVEQYPYGAKRGSNQYAYGEKRDGTGGDLMSFQESQTYFPWGII